MARINIEECWWTDPRRSKLIRLMGGDEERADGAAVRMWRLAQENWKHGGSLVPREIFMSLEYAEILLGACLAESRSDFVYVRGSSQYLDWTREQKENARVNGSKGGKVSAQRPRDEKGRLLPKSKIAHGDVGLDPQSPNGSKPTSMLNSISSQNENSAENQPKNLLNKHAKVQAPSKPDPSESKPSDSVSSSLNLKNDQNSNLDKPTRDDFEQLYLRAYPRKEGKKRGIEICVRTIKTFERMQDLESAIHAYAAHCKKSNQYLKHFGTFMGEWEEWLDPSTGKVVLKAVPSSSPDPFDEEIKKIMQAKRQFNGWQENEARAWLGDLGWVIDLLGGWTDVQMLSDDQASRNKIIRALTEGHVEANHA